MSKKALYIPYYIQYPDHEWKPIILDGEKSDYLISNGGIVVSKNKKHKRPVILDGHVTLNGYRIYDLLHNGKDHWMLGQRLVALAFIPILEHLKEYSYDELEVNHIKGDGLNKLNNSITNLEWCTSSENKYHAYRTKLKLDAENHPEAIYTNDQIHNVCYLLEENKLSRMEIAINTGVDDATVGMILSKKQWKSVSKYYDFSQRKKKKTPYSKEVINEAMLLLNDLERNCMTFAEIGRKVGMSRSSVWYLYNKYFKKINES